MAEPILQKAFYNKTTKKLIIDISDKKTLAQIKVEYGEGDYEFQEFDSAILGCVTKNDKLEFINLLDEATQKELEHSQKTARKEAVKTKVKNALSLSQQEMDDLFG